MNSTTKLEAVNILLTSIGEDPVSALGTGIDDQTVAEAVLDEVLRRTLVRGWSWNTEVNYTLPKEVDDTVTVPANFLSIDFNNRSYVQRGDKVYDKVNHTYNFESNLTGLTVILGLDWDETPEACRQYVLYSAGRVFQARQVGSRVLHEFTKQDEHQAWLMLNSNENAVGNVSIFQNAEIAVALNRSSGVPVPRYPAGSILGSY